MSELLTFKRFVELESRVRRIERHLQLAPEPLATSEPAAVPAVDVAPAIVLTPMPQAMVEQPAPAPQVDHGVRDDLAVTMAGISASAHLPPPLPGARKETVSVAAIGAMMSPTGPSPVLPYRAPAVAAQRKDRQSSFEQWIGLNWTGWVGAIVLVIGAALGIKYAYDRGWLGGLPKEVRLGLCFAAGLGLLGIGEWIDRKINRISAACVLGAGVATLFVVSYAGFGYFELYAQSTAFVLMAISTFIGCGVAMRKNLVSIAALSLLGGNLAPVILQSHEPRYAALLGYVLTLQIIALVLTAVCRGGKWWVLRGFAVVMPAFWVGAV